MVIIGVDPHKLTHTASSLDPVTNGTLDGLKIDASIAGYRQLLRWASRFPDRRWAVENARGLGRHLAQWLVARGEVVDDVPSTATARIRQLSRGRRKNDVIDASAAASVAAMQGEANPVAAEDLTTVLALLDERRANVTGQPTRLVNQLHALLRDLVPGGARTDLTASIASRLLASVRTAGPAETARKVLARDLIAEIRDADQRLKTLTSRIEKTVAEHGSRLTTVDGVGPVIAGRLLGRTRRASRFASASAFAAYAGVAPVEIASADRARHRLPRGGDRQLNLALHIAALTQVRMRASRGRAYYDTKVAAGKTHNEAMRCLKRRLADHIWRLMLSDERRKAADPGGHTGATTKSSAEKTTIAHIDEGFEFLGFRIQRQTKRGSNKRFVYTWPSRKSLEAIKAKVKTITRQGTNNPLSDLLRQLNPVLRGWTNYFRHAVSKATFSYLHEYTWRRVIGWMRRKHRRTNWKEFRRRHLANGWWPEHDGRSLFDTRKVPVTRYRYRGAAIPTPWPAGQTITAS